MRDTQLYSPAQPPLTTGRHRYSISDLISIWSSFERGKGDAVHTKTHMQMHPHPHTLASMRTRTYIHTLARTSPSNFLPLLCLLAYFFCPFRHTDTHTCACAHAQAMVIHHIITGFCWGYMLAMNFAYTFACVGDSGERERERERENKKARESQRRRVKARAKERPRQRRRKQDRENERESV